MVMEFIEGIRLSECDTSYLSSNRVQDALHKFGLLISFDLLINNWDRIPIEGVWTNKGNATNVLLRASETSTEVFAIDHTFTIITQPKLRVQYSGKVKEFIQRVNSGDYSQLEAARRLLMDSNKWDIGAEGVSMIAKGVKDGLEVLRKLDIEEVIKESLEKAAPLLGDPQDLESSIMIATFMLEPDLECIRVFHKAIRDGYVH